MPIERPTATASWSSQRAQAGNGVTLSAGLATLAVPTCNFPTQELIDAAERCLFGAQASGGSTFKSLDIY